MGNSPLTLKLAFYLLLDVCTNWEGVSFLNIYRQMDKRARLPAYFCSCQRSLILSVMICTCGSMSRFVFLIEAAAGCGMLAIAVFNGSYRFL